MPVPLGGLGAKILDRGEPGGVPSVQVLLDDGTGTFPFDLTSTGGKSYVLQADGISFSRGKQDWQSGVTAGGLTLTLDNSDGRFTVGSTVLASPSPIKVDQRIRVNETVNGTTFTRFTGYVKQWPVAWPATVTSYAVVHLVATDAQARAERQVLRSMIEQVVLADLPVACYVLGEPTGAASAADSSGNQAPNLVPATNGTAVTFGAGQGLATTSLSAPSFPGDQWLTARIATAPAAVEIWFQTTTNDAVIRRLADPFYVQNGNLYGQSVGLAATGVADGAWHQLVLNVGGNAYFDNASVGASDAIASQILAVGGGRSTYSPGPSGYFSGQLTLAAFFSTTLSPTQIDAHYQAGKTGFAGESGTARITRLAGYAGLPVGTLDTSLTNVAFTALDGRSAWDANQEVADAEFGIAFFDGSGNLTFHNRNRPAGKTQPDLTLTKDAIASDVQPVHDDFQILNYVEGTAAGTKVTQVARDATSETSHGHYPDSKTYLVQTNDEALDRINWIVANFAEPTTRYGTLTINMYALSPDAQATVLTAIEINSWLRVVQMPSQNTGGATVDVVAQGYSETVGVNTWTLTLNVVSKSLSDCIILDDPVRGLPDGTYRLYV